MNYADKLSRRAALRRIGMTGGLSVLGLLTIDDLARLSAGKLAQTELTRGLAADLRSAGVAFADVYGPLGPAPRDPGPRGEPLDPYPECNGNCDCICHDGGYVDCRNARPAPAGCDPDGGTFSPHCTAYNNSVTACRAKETQCYEQCTG